MTEIHASVNIYCQGTHPPLIVTLFWENMNKSLKKRHWENHQYEVGSKKNQENQIPGSTTSCHIIYLWIKHPEIECRRKKNIFFPPVIKVKLIFLIYPLWEWHWVSSWRSRNLKEKLWQPFLMSPKVSKFKLLKTLKEEIYTSYKRSTKIKNEKAGQAR